MLAAVRNDPSAATATALTSFFRSKPGDLKTGWCPWGSPRGWIAASHPWARDGVLVDRDEVLRAGGYDEWVGDFCEWDLYYRLGERGHAAAVVPEFLIHRRVGQRDRLPEQSEWHTALAAVLEKHHALNNGDQYLARILIGDLVAARQVGLRHHVARKVRQVTGRATPSMYR
jgi:hypothetical protein